MNEFLNGSLFFGVFISFAGYMLGIVLKKYLKLAIFNPLLIAIIFDIAFLLVFDIDFTVYYSGAKYISYFLTPATVCLAIPLYEQINLLKRNWKAILTGVLTGVVVSLGSVYGLSLLFNLNHEQYVTLLPKSITTAIGLGVVTELGGITSVTVTVIVVTGIFGSIIGEFICKIFHINNPIARGVAMGTSSHVIGTTKAFEMGEKEGSISSLALAVAGIITVVGASIFASFI